MKKNIILSLTFFAVFILLVFRSSFCWASSEIVVTYPDINGLSITIDNSDNFLNDYSYCYLTRTTIDNQGRTLGLYFTTEPIFKDSSFFWVSNQGHCQYITFNTYNVSDLNFSFSSSDFTSFQGYSGHLELNINSTFNTYYNVPNSIYSDSSLTTYYSNNNFVYNTSFISGFAMSMYDYVDIIASNLSVDFLFQQVNNSIPLIVISVLFVLGFILVRKLVKGSSKGKLKV